MRTPLQAYRLAETRHLELFRIFNEIQTSPNPITPEEVDRLIEKRPQVYGALYRWGARYKKEHA